MDVVLEFAPYIGALIVLGGVVVTIGVLAKRGILVRSFGLSLFSGRVTANASLDQINTTTTPQPSIADTRSYTIERVSRIAATPTDGEPTPTTRAPVLNADQVSFSDLALADLEALGLTKEMMATFLTKEMIRHPLVFSMPAFSQTLLVGDIVLVFSWNMTSANVERAVLWDQSYSHHEVWARCVSHYRRAANLEYRSAGFDVEFNRSKLEVALKTIQGLVERIQLFAAEAPEQFERLPSAIPELNAAIENAEFFLMGDQLRQAVAQLEIVVSTAHKVLVRTIPVATPTSAAGIPEIDDESLPSGATGQQHVLVVDDDENLNGLVCQYLSKRFPTVAFVPAFDGFQATRYMIEREYIALIVDINLPGVDGYQLIRQMSRFDSKCHCIAMSGMDDKLVQQRVLESGADMFLKKPLTLDVLPPFIEKWL